MERHVIYACFVFLITSFLVIIIVIVICCVKRKAKKKAEKDNQKTTLEGDPFGMDSQLNDPWDSGESLFGF